MESTSYSSSGADTCLKCHNRRSKFPVLEIFKSKHANTNDKRTPFSGLQCEACHGPGADHVPSVMQDSENKGIINFGRDSSTSIKEQNAMCEQCHRGENQMHWIGSAHQAANIACTNCHVIHAGKDPVQHATTQAKVCYQCHSRQRAEFLKTSSHPVRFNKMTCSECHSVHDAIGDALLIKNSVNDTCYACHAEKRGPFLWEHAPASEDCSLCHRSHGSNHRSLLVKRPPFLCQQCHSSSGHPSIAYSGAGLPGNSASGFLLAKSCNQCHVQVHGSNHPSGVTLMR